MIERPSSRSTSAPSTFIATSQVPVPRPTISRPRAATGTDPSAPPPRPRSSSPRPSTRVAATTVRRAPNRAMLPPAVGRDATEPMEPASRNSPSWPGPRSRSCRMDGIREAQVEKAKPLRKKVASTALRAVTTSRVAVPVETRTRATLAARADHLATAGCPRRDRIRPMSKTVITFGTFDVFHVGHLRVIERAAALGDRLVVGVSADALNERKKGRSPVFSQSERLEIVAALKPVDAVFVEESLELKRHYILEHEADILVMGDDWAGKFDEFEDICEVHYLTRTPAISTTALIEKISNATS